MVSKSLEWLKERTVLEKALLSMSSILLLTLLIMILIGATYQGKKSNHLNDETTCWSEECRKTAVEVLKSMEPEADACRNFYDYACGKYGLEPEQTVSAARRSTESLYLSLKRFMESKQKFDIKGLDDVRNFYNTCMTFSSYALEKKKEFRESLLEAMIEESEYTWPIMDPLYSLTDYSLERHLTNLILLDVPVVFQMEVVQDQESYLLKISPGRHRETGRPPGEIRSDDRLRASVAASFILIGSTSVISDADEVLKVDFDLANITQQAKNRTCEIDTLAPHEVAYGLKRLFPETDWDVILSIIRNKTGLVMPFAVELYCKQTIKDHFEYLQQRHIDRSRANYLGWRLFSQFMEIMIPSLEKFRFGTAEPIPRWRVCLEHMDKFFSPVFAELLSIEIFEKDVQEEVERISDATLNAAKLLVSRASWMSDVQRSRIEDKVSKIRIRYPYKRLAHNGDAAQIVIPKVDVTNFPQVVMDLQREEVIQRFRRLDGGAESTEQAGSWKPLLTEVDNFTSSDLTAFVYFDKVRAPYLRMQGPQWMNYGGFGMFIAREVSKLLMSLNAGVGNEKEDLVWNVWSKYTDSHRCLPEKTASSLYSSIKFFSYQITHKELQKIFLDHSTLEIAYQAAKSTAASSKSLPGLDFSDEQLFFVSYAQTICEADFDLPKNKTVSSMEQLPPRVRFLFINKFESFEEVFSCKSNFYCQIWG